MIASIEDEVTCSYIVLVMQEDDECLSLWDCLGNQRRADQCLLFIVYLLSDIILLEHSHVLVKSC